MSITKRYYNKRNKPCYQAQIYIKGVRVKSKTFEKKTEACRWHAKEKEKLLKNHLKLKRHKEIFFADCFKRYLKEAFPLIHISTRQSFEGRFRYFTEGPLFHFKMKGFNAQSIHTWINWLKQHPTAKNKKRKSFLQELKILSVILNWYRNFVNEDFNIPITKKHRQLCHYKPVIPRPPDYFIRPNDAKNWVQWLRDNKVNPAYWRLAAFMLLTGTRVSEACGMCWDAVDLEEGTARTIRRIRWDQKTKQPHLEDAGKTSASIRLLHLPNELIEILKQMKQEDGSKGLLFKNLNGHPLSYTRIPLCFNQAFKALGLPWRSTHICRHTYATIALYATRDISAVQASLGHTSSQMTERYAKVIALLSRTTAEKTARAFNLFGHYSENHSENHSRIESEAEIPRDINSL